MLDCSEVETLLFEFPFLFAHQFIAPNFVILKLQPIDEHVIEIRLIVNSFGHMASLSVGSGFFSTMMMPLIFIVVVCEGVIVERLVLIMLLLFNMTFLVYIFQDFHIVVDFFFFVFVVVDVQVLILLRKLFLKISKALVLIGEVNIFEFTVRDVIRSFEPFVLL